MAGTLESRAALPDPVLDFERIGFERVGAPAPRERVGRPPEPRRNRAVDHGADTHGRLAPDVGAPAPGGWLVPVSVTLGVVWAGVAVAGLTVLTDGGFASLGALGYGVAALLAVGPALVIALLGLVARELARFRSIALRLEAAAERLTTPISSVRSEARALVDTVGGEIARLDQATTAALRRLGEMEGAVGHHVGGLDATTLAARAAADQLLGDLDRVAAGVASLSDQLQGETRALAETIQRQAELVAAASDLAATQAREGQALLDDGADKLTRAGGGAQKAAEKVAFAISEQVKDLDALVKVLDDRGADFERAAAIQRENIGLVQSSASELSLAADASAQHMRSAVDAAVDQARRLVRLLEEEGRKVADRAAAPAPRARAPEPAPAPGPVPPPPGPAPLPNGRRTPFGARGPEAGPEPAAPPPFDAPPAPAPRYPAPPATPPAAVPLASDGITSGVLAAARRRASEAESLAPQPSAPPRPAPPRPADHAWDDIFEAMDAGSDSFEDGARVAAALRRAGVDLDAAFGPETMQRIVRTRRMVGQNEARDLVYDLAPGSVRQTRALLDADPAFAARASAFHHVHARAVRRAAEIDDVAPLAGLLGDHAGRAFLLLDAILGV